MFQSFYDVKITNRNKPYFIFQQYHDNRYTFDVYLTNIEEHLETQARMFAQYNTL